MYRNASVMLALFLIACLHAHLAFGQNADVKPGQAFSVRIPVQTVAPVFVKLTPLNPQKQASFIFSAADRLPGTSQSVDYGRFFRNVQAFSANHQSLAVHRIGTNQWQIYDGKNFAYLTYEVALSEIEGVLKQQTTSGKRRPDYVFLPCMAILGWVHGHESGTQKISIAKPENWQIASNLTKAAPNSYTAHSFFELDASIIAAGKSLELAHFSAFHLPHIIMIHRDPGFGNSSDAHIFRDLTRTAGTLFSNAPFERYYTFLEFLQTPYRSTKTAFQVNAFDNGQHLVVMSERISAEDVQDNLLSHYLQAWLSESRYFKASVEDYYSQQFAYGDWLMEGLSLYYSARLLTQVGQLSVEKFLQKIAKWANEAQQRQDALTSAGAPAAYGNGFARENHGLASRGALIGMLLDVQILYQSRGFKRLDHGLQNLEKAFRQKSEKMHVTELPNLIEDATSISVDDFFKFYLEQSTPLPLEKAFASLALRAEWQGKSTITELTFLPESDTPPQAKQLRQWWLKNISTE